MNCDNHKMRLADHLDGLLNEVEKAELERHLASCAECRAEVEELRATVEALRSLKPVMPPAGFAASVSQRIKDEARPKSNIFRLSFIATIASVAAAVAITFAVITSDPEQNSPQSGEFQHTAAKSSAPLRDTAMDINDAESMLDEVAQDADDGAPDTPLTSMLMEYGAGEEETVVLDIYVEAEDFDNALLALSDILAGSDQLKKESESEGFADMRNEDKLAKMNAPESYSIAAELDRQEERLLLAFAEEKASTADMILEMNKQKTGNAPADGVFIAVNDIAPAPPEKPMAEPSSAPKELAAPSSPSAMPAPGVIAAPKTGQEIGMKGFSKAADGGGTGGGSEVQEKLQTADKSESGKADTDMKAEKQDSKTGYDKMKERLKKDDNASKRKYQINIIKKTSKK